MATQKEPTPDRTPEPPYDPQPLEQPGLESKMDPRPRYLAPSYEGSGKLEGKSALITGGDSGIGRSVAVLFAREGASVAIVHLEDEQEDAAETLEAIEREGVSGVSLIADLKDKEACERVVDEAITAFGKLDILVNNAAYQKHRDGLEDVDHEQWKTTFDTNINAYFSLAKAAVPRMEDGGAIINTSSIIGLKGKSALIDYAATKGAINAFTKALAQDLVPRRIRVNCVAPGPVWTPLNPAERGPEEVEGFGEGSPYGRPAQPEEVAPTYVFLASNACSSYITGEIITLLGGSTRAA